jgi:ABC-2 type transport system permease protein
MSMKTKTMSNPYLTLFSIGIKDTLAYKANFILSLFSSLAQAGLMILIWTAIYHFTNTTSLVGITLSSMYIYFFLVYAFRSVINMNLPEVMQQDVQSGSVAAAYTRPLKYPLQVFFNSIPDDMLYALIITLPLLVIAVLLSPQPVSSFTALLVVVELAIGYSLVSLIGFMIGMLAIKMVNIYGIANSMWSIMLLLGGGVMPLALFPNAITHILMFTPFPIMLYTPAATFLGIVSSSEAINSIIISAVWVVALAIISAAAWKFVRKRITSAGG